MIVYLDLIIISTIIVDFTFLKIIGIIWNEKIKIFRLICGLLINIILILSFIFPFKDLIYLRYIIGTFIILVVFEIKSIKDYFIKVITYYILNIMYIGIIAIFNIKDIYILIVSLIIVSLLWLVQNYKIITIKEVSHLYNIKIGKELYKGYLDTGNCVYYEGIPVVLMNYKHYSRIYKRIGSTKVVGINYSIIDIYDGPPLRCGNSEYIVYYTFTNNINYDLILHRDCN